MGLLKKVFPILKKKNRKKIKKELKETKKVAKTIAEITFNPKGFVDRMSDD